MHIEIKILFHNILQFEIRTEKKWNETNDDSWR